MASPQSIAWAKFSPVVVQGGTSTSCTIGLTAPAGSTGFNIGISTTHSFVQIPSVITIPSGSKQMSFNVPIGAVTSNHWATVTFNDGSRSVAASVEAVAPVDLAAADMNPESVVCGASAEGHIRLTNPAPAGGFTVSLYSSQDFVQVPATVTVPPGKQDSRFLVTTSEVSRLRAATITITSADVSVKTWLQVVQNPSVKSLGLSSPATTGGYGLTGKITIDQVAPPGGTTVQLSCDDEFVQIPTSVTVPHGKTTVTFAIATSAVLVRKRARLTSVAQNSGQPVDVSFDVVPPGLAAGPWPKFHGDLRNTGLGASPGTDGTIKWSLHVDSYSSPAIGPDGTMYMSGVGAINSDGTLRWATDKGSGTPAIGSDGTIYIPGGVDNKLYALNPDGSTKWIFDADGHLLGSPTIASDGTIYFSTGWGGRWLYALTPDGKEKWSLTLQAGIGSSSSPSIGPDGTIYCTKAGTDYGVGEPGGLYAINPDGSIKWRFADGRSSPVVGSDGTIYCSAGFGDLVAVNPDGTQKWNRGVGRQVNDPPAIGPDGTIYAVDVGDNLVAFSPDGTTKW
ncbi:MAG TPA: PQQ-binding-like beta-propeller repeat protein, partial [Fimbriimonas sp.]|nr:PQQ-binding-like beta-propeller repeat protein [Fimbriimonas sp.]